MPESMNPMVTPAPGLTVCPFNNSTLAYARSALTAFRPHCLAKLRSVSAVRQSKTRRLGFKIRN